MGMNLNPKRLENESFADYKNRRKMVNDSIKEYLRGHFVKYTKKEERNRG